ncbi:Trichodiene oxygenase [Cyphellophora attinorum]|uniref:Trichodiene oxygenase n=1 Tax=Cyphellophora attinorum TaxID=1664694 RepID=A0A0N0NK05_9EURO|nr:Trichodiene oxygenase [Phialophora attinorum]KPI37259.1 Trichodiene oxygenase [Phialophora attinorum]
MDLLDVVATVVNVSSMATRAVLEVFRPLPPRIDNLSDVDNIGFSPAPESRAWWPVTPATLCVFLVSASLIYCTTFLFYNAYLHPLRSFPGPLAGRSTEWWKVYIEVFQKESWAEVLQRLHERYGDVVRTAPNELHFANPQAYFDIYAPAIRWDKEETLYHSMAVDNTSFGYLKYQDAKQRKDVLQPLFSRRAVSSIQGLVKQKLDDFCDILTAANFAKQPSNLYLGLRCLTVDTISAFCFGKSVGALAAPSFNAPIVQAMDFANPEGIPIGRSTIPPDLSGFAQIANLTQPQVDAVIRDPSTLEKFPNQTIYHRLLDPSNQDGHPIPSREHILQEAKNLIFAGSDTTGNTLYVGFWQLIQNQALQSQLRTELKSIWPDLAAESPTYEAISSLPLLSAIIKESLRVSSGVVSPLSRVVPQAGATIDGHRIPGGTIVGMSAIFMHYNTDIFPDPHKFNPRRWISGDDESPSRFRELERYLVPFSRGPRSCLGINLAYCELSMTFAWVVRKFELSLSDEEAQKVDVDEHGNLVWRDTFLPWFYGRRYEAFCRPVGS